MYCIVKAILIIMDGSKIVKKSIGIQVLECIKLQSNFGRPVSRMAISKAMTGTKTHYVTAAIAKAVNEGLITKDGLKYKLADAGKSKLVPPKPKKKVKVIVTKKKPAKKMLSKKTTPKVTTMKAAKKAIKAKKVAKVAATKKPVTTKKVGAKSPAKKTVLKK